ncbi:MAG TPA: phosphoglycerate kinase [Cryomorphaceae bacterium]|nr:phosphoglycerate kinase [Cryomorphaceae bacterium]
MKTINDLKLEGKRVLVRVDFNVPLNKSLEVTDDTRIRATIPTIKAIMEKGGHPVLMSHLGRPDGIRNPEFSLKSVVAKLEELSGKKVKFVEDCIGQEAVSASKQLGNDEILMLENLRFYNEETDGDEEFARRLSENGDVYINDAFGTAHRAHASTAIIARFFPKSTAAGLVMAAEIENVGKVLEQQAHPVTALVGGAKVSSKIDILQNLIPKLDNLIIGGGMAYTFIKAKGGSIGKSLVEDSYLETAREILKSAEKQGVNVYLPKDSVNSDEFANDGKRSISDAGAIDDNLMGLDVGPETLEEIKPVIEGSKTILWNGPMGVFEFENFSNGTKKAADYIAEATKNGAFSLVGGGDSVAAVKKFNMQDDVSYVSTGGGAMLEYLEGKELPGIKALN